MATAPAFAALDEAAAEALMKKHKCANCHTLDRKVIGPAYRDVAAKYKNDQKALAKLMQKVKQGGAGAWGPIAMPPNDTVPAADIEALVAWILTLKP
jgi:cytochrome c